MSLFQCNMPMIRPPINKNLFVIGVILHVFSSTRQLKDQMSRGYKHKELNIHTYSRVIGIFHWYEFFNTIQDELATVFHYLRIFSPMLTIQ